MIRRQHVEHDFFDEAEALRETLDTRFKDAYTDNIPWYYFCDPRMYTYLRTEPQKVFPKAVFERFRLRLRNWSVENLGLVPMGLPYLHMMVNGCRLDLHSDFHNGCWGYVYSLTRWNNRRFAGGETLLMRDGVPSYKKHHVHGEVLYELVPAEFNQLLVFDDRIVHGTPTIEGTMDPLDARIAMVGHIRATSPIVSGSMPSTGARKAVLEILPQLRDRLKGYKDVQGTASYRLDVQPTGRVETVTPLTDNVVTQQTGYDKSDIVSSVRMVIQQTLEALTFPTASGRSSIIVPLLLPVPDLRPIAFQMPHGSSCESIREWAATHMGNGVAWDVLGSWEGDTLLVREPIEGTIRIGPSSISVFFDPPMWVPSQRESFQKRLTEWATSASRYSEHATYAVT